MGHAMGHSFGAVFHVPHGRNVGVFLTYVNQFCLNNPEETDKSAEILGTTAKKLGWAEWSTDNKKAAYIVIDRIKELQKTVEFPTKLADVGISREDFDKNLKLLTSLCFQSSCSVMAPRSANAAQYNKLFTYAFEGKDVDF